jgi:hypothetical protein
MALRACSMHRANGIGRLDTAVVQVLATRTLDWLRG